MNADTYLGLAEVYRGNEDIDKAIENLETGLEKTGDQRLQAMLDMLRAHIQPEQHSTVSVDIPDVTGMSEEDALKTFDKLEIAYEIN